MENTGDLIEKALQAAQAEQEAAGRSKAGRYLALAVTSLEQAESWYARSQKELDTPGYPSDAEIDEALERGKRLQEAGSPK